jgi:hypothetical protein
MAFKFKDDRPRPTRKYPTPASVLIDIGTPLKIASNALALATVGAPVRFLANGTKAASDSATTAIEVIPIRTTDIFIADVGTGTMASSYIGNTCDLKSGATSTIDLTADVKHDVTIEGWDGVDTTKAYVSFNATKLPMVP